MNRVASIDAVVAAGPDLAVRRGSEGSRRQRARSLSFNPFPDYWEFSASRKPIEYVAAYEVAKWKRICKSQSLSVSPFCGIHTAFELNTNA